jgi:catechol 2,3-dioxygenase-like lactoylglutathione lyase family enzyme
MWDQCRAIVSKLIDIQRLKFGHTSYEQRMQISMSETKSWPGSIFAMTIFAEDLPAAREFYQKAFGLPIHWEDADSCVFLFGETMINLLKVANAPTLIEPVPVADPSAGARFQLTLAVDDVDAKLAELQSMGIEILNGPIDRPWGIRTATFRDPTGTIWEIAR